MAALAPTDAAPPKVDERYADELFEAADIDGNKGHLTRLEFRNALSLHHHALTPGQAASTAQARPQQRSMDPPPNWRTLRLVFLGSAIPFVGFGFLDNFIMLMAGEEIDSVLGPLGLSTLASAGLGNLLADVLGIGAARWIEQAVRPYMARYHKLSQQQALMRVTKVTKIMGASLGVSIGCVLGMLPLFLSGGIFVPKAG